MLVRDVAYGQIPRASRADKHRRAAEWIESLGRAEDHAEMLAHHFVSALETARAAGQDSAPLEAAAARALRDAGDRALALHSTLAASRLYDRALTLMAVDDPSRPRLVLSAATARFDATFDNLDELTSAHDLLLAAGDREAAARAAVLIANYHWSHGSPGEVTREQLERAAELAEALPASPSKAVVLAELSRFHMLGDRFDLAGRFAEEALELADELDLDEARANVLNNLGTMKVAVGDRSGIADLERSIALAEAHNSAEAVRGYNNLAYCLYRLGDLRHYAAVTERMQAASERFGGDWVSWAADRRVHVLYQSGEWDEAAALLEKMLAGVATGSGHYLEAAWRDTRARIRLARGDTDGAEEDASVALDRAQVTGDAQLVIPMIALRARMVAEERPELARSSWTSSAPSANEARRAFRMRGSSTRSRPRAWSARPTCSRSWRRGRRRRRPGWRPASCSSATTRKHGRDLSRDGRTARRGARPRARGRAAGRRRSHRGGRRGARSRAGVLP